ncbi:MAG: type II toxin-antitoxin system RnlA family toxin [Stygiobacter sp.]
MHDKAQIVKEYFLKYCNQKDYQIEQKEEKNGVRITVSNGLEKVPIIIYNTGKFVPEGSPKLKLRKEFDELKVSIEKDPEIILREIKQKKSVSAKYVVIGNKKIDEVLESIKSENYLSLKFETSPHNTQLYRVKIESDKCNMVITQFKNGTLLLQGKENNLFDKICTLIEKILLPAEKDVALRFLSNDEKTMEEFISIYTPKILEKAEENIKKILGKAFDFLEEHDKKYLIASECLVLAKLNLPEFSPVVMPAAKAFEGFTKKVGIKIGLFPNDHFKAKGAGLSILSDKTHPNRKAIHSKEKYASSFLDKLSNTLDMARNFMMHSDDSQVTKVNSHDEAIKKQRKICEDMKELFEYFNKPEFGDLIK